MVGAAHELQQELDAARGEAVAAASALKRANERWQQGIAAACSRLLAKNLRCPTEAEAIAKIADALLKTPEELLRSIDRTRLKTDGPQKAADGAIGVLMGVDERTVRRWRSEDAGREHLFERVLAVETTPEAPSSSPTGLAAAISAMSDAALGIRPFIDAVSPKNKA